MTRKTNLRKSAEKIISRLTTPNSQLTTHATATLDGFDWSGKVEATHTTRFGESAVNITISSPNLNNPDQTIGFLQVPLKVGAFTVKKSITSFDSTEVLGYYQPDVRFIPFVSYIPVENERNILAIQAYNKVTGEIFFAFENTFENPPGLGPNKVVISEGVGRTTIR